MKITKLIEVNRQKCICCMEEHEVKRVEAFDEVTYQNEKVGYNLECFYCENDETFFEDEDQMSRNGKSLKDAYREKVGLYTSNQIIDLRKKYDISQQDLCKVLGWGGKTVNRYENSAVQDKAHDNILKKIDKDPEWFLELLDAGASQINEESFIKSYKAACKEYAKEKDAYQEKVNRAKKLEKELK